MNEEPLFIARRGSSPLVTAEIAGSKAAQLWRMAQLGLDVPPAFVLPASLCAAVNAGEKDALAAVQYTLDVGIAWLEGITGRRFGDSRQPLLVSVRSGAAASMPGMLDTILDIGLNEQTVRGMIRMSGNPRLAFDSFRRLVQGYAEVVAHVPGAGFERCLSEMMQREAVAQELDLDPEALERLTSEFREYALRASSHAVPMDPREQLQSATIAVYRSWESARAKEYRRLNHLEELKGTAVTVQAMVFGNSGGRSGAGVAFSRNPATGVRELYVDFLFDAQGEDVVSGRRTPGHAARLAGRLPDVAKALAEGVTRIETEMRDAQDVEFTVEDGRLYFLQTRAAKRTPLAALRIAVDLVHESLIDVKTALARLAPLDIGTLGMARFATPAPAVATAISAAPGVASGRVAFDSLRAKELATTGAPVILVRPETSTEDVEGFALAAGILTAVGGRTAHAAVVARQLGKVCLVGCRALVIDEANRAATLGDAAIHEGDWLSLDGDRGEISLGERAVVTERPPELAEIARWQTQAAKVPA
ncbi:PEP/pyruvate-binding domain-containing protein [Methylovirgula sp. HY1]|uniref:PEP/pyruvate-binding domain-containing protein n=1 Tax=Methylovirgula sp. HY1 TaxID=2822761 RepID=UPI001C5A99E8|nr:PEP/pyruvate-binding domain-containing protein [Methylovirgula sp. HY1]QXX74200.1 Pyruvate, phosphate dikinase [Methylovirgula sp. HY1]